MNSKVMIDTTKVLNTINNMTVVENLINTNDLEVNFVDIEKLLNDINLKHGNCLNYTESLESIRDNLVDVKRMINELIEALRRTNDKYKNSDSLSSDELKELADIYRSNPVSEKFMLMAEKDKFAFSNLATDIINQNDVTIIPPPEEQQESSNQINTLPIGIAIGAAGVVGSVGAVIIDDIYGPSHPKKKKSSLDLDDYGSPKNTNNILADDDYSNKADDYSYTGGHYKASRMEREADRYYGEELKDVVPNENDLNIEADDYNDKDDDFYE